jgi:hypothetical protein
MTRSATCCIRETSATLEPAVLLDDDRHKTILRQSVG